MPLSATAVLAGLPLASSTVSPRSTTQPGDTVSDTDMVSLSRRLSMVTKSKCLSTGLILTPGSSRGTTSLSM